MSRKKRTGPTKIGDKQASATALKSPVAQPNGQQRWRLPALLLAAAVLVAGYVWLAQADQALTSPSQSPGPISMQMAKPGFVGAQTCAGCHAAEASAWQGSQHAKAMQHASEATVLGNFNNARFDYYGVTSTFFRRDGRFFVNTDGPDGRLADFEIRYVFGIEPLQQYLITFPDGRLQALSIAWDSRPAAAGGNRWYHLYPNEKIAATDSLHWSRRDQNWNWMCADCHSTKLDRNYNAGNNTYATSFAEMNVACEACHGAGAQHVAWAQKADGTESLTATKGLTVALDERKNTHWQIDPATGNAARSSPRTSQRELDVCGQCHSRRAPFAAGMNHDGQWRDSHDLALLTATLYYPDGQQRDEVYNLGSFLQSKMHQRGVSCSDCHNPHSGKLNAPGNTVCAQCHSPDKYDQPRHTLHTAGSAGSACASCHMPTTTYMGVDPRHDHSFRIPRPDLSAELGTPNACTGCHTDRESSWAAAIIAKQFGPQRKGYQQFGRALLHARSGHPAATAELTALIANREQPAIARATALASLPPFLNPRTLPALETGLADPDPMLRAAAVEALQATPAAERVRLATKLISDPARLVRLKAARTLAVATREDLTAPQWQQLETLFADYVTSQRANADRPEAQLNLGVFFAERQDPEMAEAAYRAALALAPDFAPAYVNLAELYRRYTRDGDAETVLSTGLKQLPDNADLLHANGLLRIRQGHTDTALPLLAQAAHATPINARYAYVYGIALHDSGQLQQSITELERALQQFPFHAGILQALSEYCQEAGDDKRATDYGNRAAALQAR